VSNLKKTLAAAAIVLYCAAPSFGIQISLDYSNDPFFSTHPAAVATLNAAAQDVASAITSSLGATVDTNSATVNSSSFALDYNYSYVDPRTGAGMVSQQVADTVLLADQVRIYVGTQSLAATTLGEGATGKLGFSFSSFAQNQADFTTAVQSVAVAGNANMRRGGGPLIKTVPGSAIGVGGATVPFSIQGGPNIGSVTFNDTVNWQLDHTAPVAPGQYDLYSVAVHEILHALGFSKDQSQSFSSEVSPSNSRNWLGSEVVTQLGTGANVLETDSQHVTTGLTSPRLSDGLRQDAVMEPSLAAGTRRSLTLLDLAFLRDIGWQTVESNLVPGDFDRNFTRDAADIQAMLGALSNLTNYQSNKNLTGAELLSIGDLDGNGLVNNRDIQSLVNLLATSASGGGSLAAVPEPSSALAFGLGAFLVLARQASRRRPFKPNSYLIQ
jgi:hypothetical protein